VFSTLYGRSREEQMARNTLDAWLELLHPDDRAATAARLHAVAAGERQSFEFRVIRPSDGDVRWVRNSDFPLRDGKGRVRRIAGIAEDMTEERVSAARLEVLVAELQHRARNLIGVISSVAGRTLERGGSVADFRVRLQALSRAQGLLSQSGTDTVEVAAMVSAELAAHAEATPDRVRIAGPRVKLTSVQVQNFALALHELTTNAVKYGALHGGAGRLAVEWDVVPRDGERWLVLTWTESGVQVAPASGERRGYGRELIERALSYALRARTDYLLGEDGVRCRIELPLA
jgi:PAS domain S-box-containing protein